MKIKELSRRTGLSTHALRFYEKIGIIDSRNIKRTENNYRDYDENIVELIRIVNFAKTAGFSLSEISDLLSEFSQGRIKSSDKLKLLKKKEEVLSRKIGEIDKVRYLVRRKIRELEKTKITSKPKP